MEPKIAHANLSAGEGDFLVLLKYSDDYIKILNAFTRYMPAWEYFNTKFTEYVSNGDLTSANILRLRDMQKYEDIGYTIKVITEDI